MRKIQIVDDDESSLKLLAEIIANAGYEVITSTNGIDALDQFRLENPDLLVTDVNMPRMNGYDLSRNVKALRSIPIVIISGSFEPGAMNKESQTNADIFLKKPLNISELLAHIDSILSETDSV